LSVGSGVPWKWAEGLGFYGLDLFKCIGEVSVEIWSILTLIEHRE